MSIPAPEASPQKLDRLSARLFAAHERNPTTGAGGRSLGSAQITRPCAARSCTKRGAGGRTSAPLSLPACPHSGRDDARRWPRFMAASGPQIVEPPRGDSRLTDRRHVVTAARSPRSPHCPIGRSAEPRARGVCFSRGRKVVELRHAQPERIMGRVGPLEAAVAPAVAALVGVTTVPTQHGPPV